MILKVCAFILQELLEVTDMYRSRLPAVFLDVLNLMLGNIPYSLGGGGGGGYSWEFLVGVGFAVSQILTLFQTKKCHFQMSSLLMLERKQKKFFKSISN